MFFILQWPRNSSNLCDKDFKQIALLKEYIKSYTIRTHQVKKIPTKNLSKAPFSVSDCTDKNPV